MLEKRLKETREKLELKEKDVALILGVSNKTISGYENGYDTIPMKNLINYANSFNISLDYLFGLTEENKIYQPIIIDKISIGNNLKELRKLNKKIVYRQFFILPTTFPFQSSNPHIIIKVRISINSC